MFWFFGHESCGILALWSGIKPISPALKGEDLTSGLPGKSQEFNLSDTSRCSLEYGRVAIPPPHPRLSPVLPIRLGGVQWSVVPYISCSVLSASSLLPIFCHQNFLKEHHSIIGDPSRCLGALTGNVLPESATNQWCYSWSIDAITATYGGKMKAVSLKIEQDCD